MYDIAKISTHYLSLSYQSLINGKIIHFFIFLIDISFVFLQILEIYYNDYNSFNIINKNYLNPLTYLELEINKLSNLIKTIIYPIIIIIIVINSYIFNNYRLKINKLIKIMINISEIFFYRLFSLIIFNYLFIFRQIYLIINIFFTIPYVLIVVLNFSKNHLFLFFPNLINYPYDSFSMIIDNYLLFIKILIALSRMGSNRNISKFCFIMAISSLFILFFNLSYIMINKSYYLMNNSALNKARFSLLLTIVISMIIILIINKSKIFHIYSFISLINFFIINIVSVFYFYDPYKYAKFDRDDNIENIFYYFFMFDRDKNKYFLIDEKIEEHISKCNMCNLCKKYNKVKNKNKEIDLYKIIYNGEDILFNLMNIIIRRIKKNGKNSFVNNSYYLINIMYAYCKIIKDNNYNVLLNIELIFEIINSENKLVLEENKISLARIKYANDFFNKANKVIEHINEILDEKKFNKNIKNFFTLGEELEKLKYNELKSNFNNNWSNRNYIGNNADGLPNCNNLLTICSLFYEEFFNETISNSGISIRDNPNLLEDLINNNNKNTKQITLEIDILHFEVKIIRAGGQINKYENHNFFDIFTSIFKNEQIFEMKNILLNSNDCSDIKTKNNKKKFQKFLKGMEKEKQYINFNFLIEERDDNDILCKLLKLKLSLILLTNISNKIYLNGTYFINNDIIVSEKEKDEEKLLYFGSKKQLKNYMAKNYCPNKKKIIIKKHKSEKYLGYEKLVKLYNFLIGDKKYNVYHFLLSKKKTIYQINIINTDQLEMNNLEEEQINFLAKYNGNTFFNDMVSSVSSENNSALRSNLISYNRENKKYNNNENEAKELKIIKFVLLLIIVMFLIIIIFLSLFLSQNHKKLEEKNEFYLSFLDYSSSFHNLYFSILSSGCIANSTISNTCSNYLSDFNSLLIYSYYDVFKYFATKEEFIKNFINYTDYIFYQNQLLAEVLSERLSSIMKNLTKFYTDRIIKTLRKNISHYKLSQNYINDKIVLTLIKENITFNDFNLLMVSRFTSITNSQNNIFEPIYILNKTGEDVFNNVPDKLLTVYQESFYLIILDFKTYSNNLKLIIREISTTLYLSKQKFKYLLYFFINFILFFVIIIYIILFSILLIYMIIILKTLNKIYNELKEKINQVTIKELLKKKIENLKLLLSFYENDINKTINSLNKIYDEYRDSYNLKVKEELKLLKREGKKEVEKENSNCLKQFNYIKTSKLYKYTIKRKSIYSLLSIIVITLIIYSLNLILWILTFKKAEKIVQWKKINESVLSVTNLLLNNYLLMIYDNQTLEEISTNYETQDFIFYIFNELTPIYTIGKYKKYLKYFLNTSDDEFGYCYMIYDILETRSELYIGLQNKFKDKIQKLYNTLFLLCNNYNNFLFNNNYYLQLFSLVRKGMESFNNYNYNYNKIIEYINQVDVIKIEVMYITLYIYLLENELKNIKNSNIVMLKEIGKKIIITNIIIYPLLLSLIFISFFLYIRNINNDCKKFIHIKKIFKVCNTS